MGVDLSRSTTLYRMFPRSGVSRQLKLNSMDYIKFCFQKDMNLEGCKEVGWIFAELGEVWGGEYYQNILYEHLKEYLIILKSKMRAPGQALALGHTKDRK